MMESWISEIESSLRDIGLAVDTYDEDLLLSRCSEKATFDFGDRFDGSPNPPRSEVDTLVRYHGDIVFIFDGSQTTGLMQQVSIDGADSVQRMRVIIYDLPGSHLVWAGWAIMMVGMAWLTVLDIQKTPHLRSEEE